jgi:hypothetical protein
MIKIIGKVTKKKPRNPTKDEGISKMKKDIESTN